MVVSVFFVSRFSVEKTHHTCDRAGSLDIGIVKTFNVIRKRGKGKVILQLSEHPVLFVFGFSGK
jgi:hypothetical protein